MNKLFLFFLLALLPKQAIAVCAQFSVKESLKLADVVFLGRVSNIQFVDPPFPIPNNEKNLWKSRRMIVEFEVFRYWKGDVKSTMTLYASFSGVGETEFEFKEGDKFLIYAEKRKAKSWLELRKIKKEIKLPGPNEEILKLGPCLRSNSMMRNETREDLYILGPSKFPQR